MGEILGIGISHFPGYVHDDADMAMRIKGILKSGQVPQELKDPQNWPAAMRAEWGEDEGTSFATRHRAQFVESARKLRAAIDSFRPDAVIICGDDQYENFREDLITPYCVYIMPEFRMHPYVWNRGDHFQPNVWNEPREQEFVYPGNVEVARFITKAALSAGYDMSYAYSLHHTKEQGLGHAFTNTLLYLDYDRAGWPYPIIPVHVNAYGSDIVRNRGLMNHLFSGESAEADPPAPSPRRLFELGQALARALHQSPWRTVLVGTSSWSHAFLTEKNHWVYPDIPSDRQRFEDLQSGNYLGWRDLTLDQLLDAGEHEVLNWMPMVGAMHELEQKPSYCVLMETWIMNSSKCSTIIPPA
ncbi:MAG: extradiol ring-cleavage dioxygenase [Chloroflexota bacterium]